MKLILITAISDYQKAIQDVLKKIGVKHYSFHEVHGYTQPAKEGLESNWFGSESATTDSVLFHIFLEDSQCDALTEAVQTLNATLDSVSKVHVISLKIENHV
ncbi:hypothetical protein [Flavobacterium stagni]|uniref:Uncharacterized protein n=1 Tax=Flavobacterium stagni TaxID=2506421 RepID=A0A4Q1K752_9FLAO|nr:hypothetical protein [Flavobacterium stagni]RXR21707.1 hypothetical protein EQG61_11905 [Flavobacterium stagni]